MNGGQSLKWRPKLKLYKSGNNQFNPETFEAHSYGWWKYVKKIKGKVVFNDYRYSSTTSGHQWAMRYLLSQLGIKIDFVVETYRDLDHFESEALPVLYEKMFQLETEMKRKGSNPKINKAREKEIKKIKNDISIARKLGAKCHKLKINEIKEGVKRDEENRLKMLAEKREEKRALENKKKELFQSGRVFNASLN